MEGVAVQLHSFLTLALDTGKWSALARRSFYFQERAPGTNWTGGWVDPRTGLGTLDKTKISYLHLT